MKQFAEALGLSYDYLLLLTAGVITVSCNGRGVTAFLEEDWIQYDHIVARPAAGTDRFACDVCGQMVLVEVKFYPASFLGFYYHSYRVDDPGFGTRRHSGRGTACHPETILDRRVVMTAVRGPGGEGMPRLAAVS